MSQREPTYNLAAIRELLLDAFTPATLRHFCQDRVLFHPVLNYVSHRPSKVDLADALIEHCQTQLLWPELLVAVEKANPRQYARYQDRLVSQGTGDEPAGTARLAPGVWPCPDEKAQAPYVGSSQSIVYHLPDCHHADRIRRGNRICFSSRATAQQNGRQPCKSCRP